MEPLNSREAQKRQHRTIALFCVIQCWVSGLDGLIVTSADLKRLLGLQQFKKVRIDDVITDIKDFFPCCSQDHEPYKDADGRSRKDQDSFSALTISRLPLDQNPKIGDFSLWEQPDPRSLRRMYEGLVPFFNDCANYDERLLTSYLSLLAQGQITPRSVPALKVAKAKAVLG
jgi:hypothetical protein